MEIQPDGADSDSVQIQGFLSDDGMESELEKIPEGFHCCVCLDLLYKPTVLACGHVSCFWCVHISMSGLRESHCPVCRHPYYHFPSICQMLHFLLLKMYPVTYKRREHQTLEFEKSSNCFSPQLDIPSCSSLSRESEEQNKLGELGQSFATCSDENSRKEACENLENSLVLQDAGKSNMKFISSGDAEAISTEENLRQRSSSGISKQVSIADLLCAACKQLLFKPVVLNCGHVYCTMCIVPDEQTIICQVCQSTHPSGFLKVCLELDHFFEETFPEEYASRSKIQPEQAPVKLESPSSHNQRGSCSVAAEDNHTASWGNRVSRCHFGVGCDYCGMYPIIGDRYKCQDCTEVIGFDLCGDCYNTRSKLPGRFNQRHTPEHKFENIPPPIHAMRVYSGNSANVSAALSLSIGIQDGTENVLPPSPPSESEHIEIDFTSGILSDSSSDHDHDHHHHHLDVHPSS